MVEPVTQEIINLPPTFTQEVLNEYIFDDLFPNSPGFNHSLPDIWDENDADQVKVTLDGLDESFSSFDYDLLEFQFFNFTESKNLTVDITLTDLEGLS